VNKSGLTPIEYKCIVKPISVEETDDTLKAVVDAGLVLPDEMKEREQMSQVRCLLVEVGGNAFDEMKEPLPKKGDTVLIAKHVGLVNNGWDGAEYRIINDKDIVAIVEDKQ
jgi:co-chaperonin GroES (HSP10)